MRTAMLLLASFQLAGLLWGAEPAVSTWTLNVDEWIYFVFEEAAEAQQKTQEPSAAIGPLLEDAERGDVESQFRLAIAYFWGRCVRQNYGEAVKWFRKAADQGNAAAQFNLGAMYADGRGVAHNHVQAHMWLNLAATASKGELRGNAAMVCQEVALEMTLEQLEEAQWQAREWKPKQAK